MSIKVEFPPATKAVEPAKGTAGLRTHLGGVCTTVSSLVEAGKATNNPKLVKQSIG